MDFNHTNQKVDEDEIISVSLSTPGGLTVELEMDSLPPDLVRSIFENRIDDAGKHLRKMTGLPLQITRKVVARFN